MKEALSNPFSLIQGPPGRSFHENIHTQWQHSLGLQLLDPFQSAHNKNVVAHISIVVLFCCFYCLRLPLVVSVISLRDWKNRDGRAHCLLVRSTKPKVDFQGFEKRQTKERGRNSVQSTTPTHLLWTIQQGRGRRYRSVLRTINKMN